MESDDWTQRTELLMGPGTLEQFQKAHVLIAGLGGVGGIAAELICRAGVGELTLADGDIVESSNRNRQIAALSSTVGEKKTEVLVKRLHDINPEALLHPVSEYLRDERLEALLSAAPYDCVLDAIDTLSPKIHLAVFCLRHNIPLVSCMGSGARLDPEQVRCADVEKTYGCTLARAVRHGLHRHGFHSGGYDAVFSPEPPCRNAVVDVNEEAGPNKRSVTGTISYMPALFACHCAAAVLRKLADPRMKGRVLPSV